MNSLDKCRYEIPIKVLCSKCGTINDEFVIMYVEEELKYIIVDGKSLMTDGETKCWYCNKCFHWGLSKETVSEILGR